jgi:hypothetical protein
MVWAAKLMKGWAAKLMKGWRSLNLEDVFDWWGLFRIVEEGALLPEICMGIDCLFRPVEELSWNSSIWWKIVNCCMKWRTRLGLLTPEHLELRQMDTFFIFEAVLLVIARVVISDLKFMIWSSLFLFFQIEWNQSFEKNRLPWRHISKWARVRLCQHWPQ